MHTTTSCPLSRCARAHTSQESIEGTLEPLLTKRYSTNEQGRVVVQLAGSLVEVNNAFRFYMATKLANPHYTPEISSVAVLLNFTITPDGLEEQLLGVVVAMERPDLENEKSQLVVKQASNVRKLKELEDRVLELLSNATGNVLDDQQLVHALSDSKIKSNDIEYERDKAAETEKRIDSIRQVPN